MTTLADLVADVYTLTNRPDLVSETLVAIRAATLKAHASDYYYKDLFETGIQFDQEQSQQSLDYKLLIPRWRSLKYVRPYLYNAQQQGCARTPLTVLTPEDILDSYGITKENVCYIAGLQLQIRTLAAFQYYLLGCYVYPNVTADGYSSWVADECPFAIIYDAVATIFKTIGQDEQNATYQALVQTQYVELKASNIIANGY